MASLCLWVCLVNAVPCSAQRDFPGVDHQWRHYQSPHFEIYSHGSERETRNLLRRLEVVRAVFLATFPLREREPSEATVYYFSNGRDFSAYLPSGTRDETVGIFNAFIDRDVMALSGSASSEVTWQIIQSQYVTHLFRLNGGKAPSWLTSGAGFLFSTLKPVQAKAVLGEVDPYRDRALKDGRYRFSCERLFRPVLNFADDRERDAWQAHACLFLHYLLLGSPLIPSERVTEFLREVAEGAGANQNSAQLRVTYEKLLGVSLDELDQAIERYRRRGSFNTRRVDVPPLPGADGSTMRAVEVTEIRRRLADLALRLQRSGEGRLVLLQASGSGDPRVLEALGMDAWMEGDRDRARERWQEAIDAGSNNPAIYHTLGLLETEHRFRYFDPYFRLNEETATRLRALFRRSIERTPSQSRAYERLAWIESAAPQPDVSNLNLVQSKFAELEEQSRVLIALAHVRIRLNDRESAAELLAVAEESDDSAFVRNAVGALRRLLERRPLPPATDR